MKTRTCFVSNSSSSSFIIAINPKVSCECDKCHRGKVDLLDLIDNSPTNFSGDDTMIRARGAKEIVAKLEENSYGNKLDDEDLDLIERVKEEAGKGLEVAYVQISNGNDMIIGEMERQKEMGKIKELHCNN